MAKHTVVFALSQRNIPDLERILWDVSDPTSENYGKHWTRAEVGAFTSNPTATKAVLEYLSTVKEVTIDHRTLYDEYITATGSVEVWEALLNTEFNVYTLKEVHSGPDSVESYVGRDKVRALIRSESYSLPSELSEHVTAVFNTVQFPELRRKKRNDVSKVKQTVDSVLPDTADPGNLSGYRSVAIKAKQEVESVLPDSQSGIIYGYVTPQLLFEYYKISNPVGSADVSQAVFETGNDAMNPDDLTYFQETFNLPVEAISEDIGGHVSTQACNANVYDGCVESNLDVQYIMAVSQSTPTTYYYYDWISWSDWITTVADTANPANVYSISWGSYEVALASSDKDSFQTEAIKLGVMGTTLVAASGDDGVIYSYDTDYYCSYIPVFPASCPYVTAVGGTSGPESNNPEISCTSKYISADEYVAITSGGGFSSYYDAPDFQKPFIKTYFSTVDGTYKQPSPSTGNFTYNSSRRGYPDVALMANRYAVAIDGELRSVSGTSASAPVFAGMLSLVNSQRVAAGKSTLGWVNPLLYKYYDSFTNDITGGDKNNCGALEVGYDSDDYYSSYYIYHNCCKEGFYPTTGWDPITGLGSINVDKFSTVFGKFSSAPTVAPSLAPAVAPVANSSKSLSTGAIIGIVVACIAVVILLIVGIVFLCHRSFSGPSPPASTAAAGTMSPVSTVELVEKNVV
jgi:tripeptidyl-peptidase-1